MDKEYFIELLNKHLKGKSSPEEEQFLISYYALFSQEPEVLDLIGEDEKKMLKTQIQEDIWTRVSEDVYKKGTRIRYINKWSVGVAAASVAILVCVSLLIFPSRQRDKREPVAVQIPSPKENLLIRLPDGSTVVLSSGSKLDYPSSFDGLAKREVYLEGQAFFDIKHNVSRPFIVHTGKLETKVLGTSFNIKAMPNDVNIVITVKSGKVRVSDHQKTLGIIIPDEQIIYNKQDTRSIQKTVNADKFLDWKRQDLFVNDLTVAEVAELLEDQFNVKISINDLSIGSKRFTATLPSDESLEQALKSICEFNGAQYYYDKEKGTVAIGAK
jgi:ferric-dicitrate binding protein FerR (iron transport regulator)